jgi:hypothetical protein
MAFCHYANHHTTKKDADMGKKTRLEELTRFLVYLQSISHYGYKVEIYDTTPGATRLVIDDAMGHRYAWDGDLETSVNLAYTFVVQNSPEQAKEGN